MNGFLPCTLLAAVAGLCLVAACSSVTNVGTVDPAADSGPSSTGTPGDDGGGDGGGSPEGGGSLPDGAKRIFITSQEFRGDLVGAGGLAGADGACESAAQGAGLGGTWKAWLSTTSVNAIDRVDDVGPWYDLEGTLIFHDKANLTTSPLAGLWIDETGTYLPSDNIWTGTGFGGKYVEDLGPGSKPCSDWTAATISEGAKIGQVGRQDGIAWTLFAGTTCDQQAHLICIEQ